MSKGNFPIRFHIPEEQENIALFLDELNIQQVQEHPPYFYFEEEEIKLDPVLEENEPNKKENFKRNRRKSYYKRQSLTLHQPSTDEHYTGRVILNGINESDASMANNGNNTSNRNKPANDDLAFTHVIFQFQKRIVNGQTIQEIQAIPVNHTYAMRKTAIVEDKTLQEVEEYSEELGKKRLESQKKFKDILKSALGLNKPKETDPDKNDEEEDHQLNGTSDNNNNSTDKTTKKDNKNNTNEDDNIFDYLKPKLQMSKVTKSKKSTQQLRNFLTESGVDYDDLKGENMFSDEVYGRFADDEEAHVAYEQEALTRVSNEEIVSSRHDDQGEYEEDDDEDDEEDDENKEEENQRKDKLRLENKSSTLVDDKALAEAQALANANRQSEEMLQLANSSSLKRSQDTFDGLDSGNKATKRARFAASEDGYPMTIEGVRKFILTKGASGCTLKNLRLQFKAQRIAINKQENDENAGTRRLSEIVNQIAEVKEDAIQGKVLFLKGN